ncbi:MAG: cation:proton antiporter [Oscillospiraceae bacterium]|nr:cation:proton antiporter [Oscillospiraceae bacterium]
MSVLFYIGIMLISALVCGRIAKKLGLPNVTGYLIAGLVLGPYLTGVISEKNVENISIVSEMALAFIAMSIGAEFRLSYFKRVGIAPVIIAILEGMLAVVFVFFGFLLAGCSIPFALVISAIAAATAPASTIMVIRQYNAKGPVSETLLSVAAIDDAVALVAFGFAVTIAKVINTGGSQNIVLSILQPIWEVLLSLIIGAAAAVLMLVPMRYFKKKSNRLCISIAFIFVANSLAEYFGASALLTCMMFGAVLANITEQSDMMFAVTDSITPPIYLLFFVVSGAQLDVRIITSIGVLGVIYLIARVLGKFAGAYLGAVICKSPKSVKKYLGFTLIPQEGVAIGLSLAAVSVVPEYADKIRAIILCATMIYELTGPVISKITLEKAGEIELQK